MTILRVVRSTLCGCCFLVMMMMVSVSSSSFVPTTAVMAFAPVASRTTRHTMTKLNLFEQKTKTTTDDNLEETTEKYGLEVGLAQAAKQGDGESAKSLLKKYGIAYLATSIPLALLSFGICYVLVDQGVDVGALLQKVGIESSSNTDKAGTFAIAYAAHKAASPIRFPPTVLLTPLVAKLIGKEPNPEGEESP